MPPSALDDAGSAAALSASPEMHDGAVESIGVNATLAAVADGGLAPFGPGMTRPEPIDSKGPAFTAAAAAKHLSGRVVLRCLITASGEVQDCAAVQGHAELVTIVIQWLTTTRYKPVTFQGKPVPVWYLFTFNFRESRSREGEKHKG